MARGRYQYPEDPTCDAFFMFGADFTALYPDRYIAVQAYEPGMNLSEPPPVEDRIPVRDVICDSCNALVMPTDPCALVPDLGRLYCWTCATEWILPHVSHVQTTAVPA